jgi:general secretion pathway protein A
MSYFAVLGLQKEPFSTSPDPEFFFESNEHHSALMRLLIEIRLKRGLSVIMGDVGTGKTTLSRKLFQMIKERGDIEFALIMDPTANDERLFLESLVRALNIQLDPGASVLDYKEAIKKHLFQKGVEENKTTVLVVDEAQKLCPAALEILRVLLNYETNEFKLLQLVLFAQMELLPRIKEIKNFIDRVALKYILNPLDENETREMINFRLKQAGFRPGHTLFTDEGIREIHKFTQGYPRRVNLLCHNALRSLVTNNRPHVDERLIREIIATQIA